ncbi:MAG TPA: hypothetical protein VE777_08765 [Gaiellales bacterium]|nr:hypothetical protein [Gaiellales bacterium]
MLRAVRIGGCIIGGWTVLGGTALAANPPTPTWQTNGQVRSIAFSNGRMYVAGEFSTVRPPGAPLGSSKSVARHNIAAFDAKTGALKRWHVGTNGRVYSIAVVGNRIYLGGDFTVVGGKRRHRLAAVTVHGKVTAWNPGADATVNVVKPGPNGNIFVGGRFGRIHGHQRTRLAEISPGGRLRTWAPRVAQITGFACPPRCSPVVFTIGFSPDGGTVYFGGHFGKVDGAARNEAAAVSLARGRILRAWNPNIYAPANCPSCTTIETSRVYHLIVTRSRIYTCGGYWKVNGTHTSYNVSAFDPESGRLDTSFNGQDDGDTPGCDLRGNILYVGGHFNVAGPGCTPSHQSSCSTRHHVAAFNVDGNSLLSWNPDANSNHGLLVIRAARKHAGFGGFFTRFGGRDQEGVALYRRSQLP